MKVSNVMTKNIRLVSPDQTLRDAARLMSEEDVGALPVADSDRLVGMVTDRDIAIRGVGEGMAADAKVRQVMTEQVKYCFEDEDLAHVSQNMASLQMRRLPVMNSRQAARWHRLAGRSCSREQGKVASRAGPARDFPARRLNVVEPMRRVLARSPSPCDATA